MINLYSLTSEELATLMASWDQPRFRHQQIWHGLYDQCIMSIDDLTSLPKSLRTRLTQETHLGSLKQIMEQRSQDGTIKRLYTLHDGNPIESVLMPYGDGRWTACISTQAGCALGCVFCATGKMGLLRNLTETEIVEQVMYFARELTQRQSRLSNVVFMGMGEPFHNYDASMQAIRRLIDDLRIGARHITVSTVGLVPQIRSFARENLQVKLAISLHAANDNARSDLIPINKRWNIQLLLDACHEYIDLTGRRVSFEWAMITDKTDTPEQAHALGKLLQGMLCHVNLIPLNPIEGYHGTKSTRSTTDRFMSILASYGIQATPRVRRGIDIDAGCGQLITKQHSKAKKDRP